MKWVVYFRKVEEQFQASCPSLQSFLTTYKVLETFDCGKFSFVESSFRQNSGIVEHMIYCQLIIDCMLQWDKNTFYYNFKKVLI